MRELLALIDVGSRSALGRHFSVHDAGVQPAPLLSVSVQAFDYGDSMQGESARRRFSLVAGLTVLLQEGLGSVKGIAVLLCLKSSRSEEKC